MLDSSDAVVGNSPIPHWLTQKAEVIVEELAIIRMEVEAGCPSDRCRELRSRRAELRAELCNLAPDEERQDFFHPFVRVRMEEMRRDPHDYARARARVEVLPLVRTITDNGGHTKRHLRVSAYDALEERLGLSEGEVGCLCNIFDSQGAEALVQRVAPRFHELTA